MELSKAEIVYLALAVRHMLEHELKNADRAEYEKIFLKLKLSRNGQKIRELFAERS